MTPERDPIDELLASISDGSPADWDAAERGIDPGARARVEALRDVARIADFSRGVQRAPETGSVPERWGDLLLLERLGGGASAEVYRAWDPGLQREVALKLMGPGGDDAALLEEGRLAARIRHPHVVTVHGVDRHEGRVGLWMELVRGAALEQEVRTRGPLEPVEVRRLGLEIGSALAAVHDAGLLHRDIKPANVIRDAAGCFVLADFGLGRRTDLLTAWRGPSGTPMYMAPELLAGAPASERSDVYALGLVLWFALAGRHPFACDTLGALAEAARRGPDRLRAVRPSVPAGLVAIVERAIAPEPAQRFEGAGALTRVLEAWRPGRTSRLWIAGALALAAALGAVWAVRALRHPEPAPTSMPPAAVAPAETYEVEASFLRREAGRAMRLVSGDQVKPGDRLSLELRATRPAWVYVLDEDERGERYLLFPQPSFDVHNPVAADSTFVLPGPVGGKEHAWTVTSAGGREYLLVVASLAPVAEIEADLARLPPARAGRPIEYARVGDAAVERLRGVGGLAALPPSTPRPGARSRALDRFRALAGRESGVRGVWVRQVVLENPPR